MRKNLYYLLIMFAWFPSQSHADFISSVSVQYSNINNNYLYQYKIDNFDESDFAVAAFLLDVSPLAELKSFSGPDEWNVAYSPGDIAVSWEPSSESFALPPGSEAVFSFESPLAPAPRDYLIVGLNNTTSSFEFIEGRIAAPSVVIPEPTSMIPIGTSLFALGSYTWYRRQQSTR